MAEGAEAAQEREEEEEVIEARGVFRLEWHSRGVRCATHMSRGWSDGCKLQCKWNRHRCWHVEPGQSRLPIGCDLV